MPSKKEITSYVNIMALKQKLLKDLACKLNRHDYLVAINDPHARRLPRACGITIHTAIGCPNACLYCYIQDMGFEFKEAKPYPLNEIQIVIALLANEYFLPGLTYLAFGSISDPFISKVVAERTLEYIEAISKILGNPIQFSTKAILAEEYIKRMSMYKNIICPLITVVSIGKSNVLEPKAPSPERRFALIKSLSKNGFKPFLFLRPLMPGINTDEIDDLLAEAKSSGAYGVIIGGFRITKRIIERLRRAGFNVGEIIRRTPVRRLSNKQINVKLSDIKREALEIAREKGLRAVLSACCAMTLVLNAYGKEVPCANCCYANGMCVEKYCGNNCKAKVPKLPLDDLKVAVEKTTGSRIKDIEVKRLEVIITLREKPRHKSKKESITGLTRMLSTLYRYKITLRW